MNAARDKIADRLLLIARSCDEWAVEDNTLTELPPIYRIAIGSARSRDRAAFAALFALDTRLGRAVAEASEPIIAQMKLAWWRDRFSERPSDWPIGEPLLAQLYSWNTSATDLGQLVDGWEELVAGEALTSAGMERFASGRRASWQALARFIGAETNVTALDHLARNFSFADLVERGYDHGKLPIVDSQSVLRQGKMPRGLRPFVVLGALGQRAVSKQRPMLDGFPSLALAVRTGLSGR